MHHRVGPFKGFNISVTQLDQGTVCGHVCIDGPTLVSLALSLVPPEARLAVEREVTQGGGIFSSDLRQGVCTHLIAQHPHGVY